MKTTLSRIAIPTLIALLLASPCPARGGEGRAITLEELLATVEASHPLFARQRATIAGAEAAQEEVDRREGWYTSVEGYAVRDESPRSQPLYPDVTERQGVTASVRRPVWATGGEVTLSHTYARSDQQVAGVTIPMGGGQPPLVMEGNSGLWYQGGTTLTYVQPLLQDRGGNLSRLASDLARYDVAVARLSSAESKEALLADVADRFIEWAYLRESVALAQKRVALAERDRERVRSMRQSNMVDQVDLIRADDAVLQAKQGVASLQAEERGVAEELARIVGDERLVDSLPALDIYAVPPAATIDEAKRLAPAVRRVTALESRIAQAARGVEGAQGLIDPRLDLVLSGASEGAGEGASDGYGADATDYTAALRFTYQWGAGSSKAARQKALFDKERLTAMKEETVRSLEAASRGIVVRMIELEKVRGLDRQRIESAEASAQAELRRYRDGRSDYTYVIGARDRVEQARMQYAADAAMSQRLGWRYRALVDHLYTKGE